MARYTICDPPRSRQTPHEEHVGALEVSAGNRRIWYAYDATRGCARFMDANIVGSKHGNIVIAACVMRMHEISFGRCESIDREASVCRNLIAKQLIQRLRAASGMDSFDVEVGQH